MRSSPSEASGSGAVALAISVVALATLPGWLVGSLAVQMQSALDFDDSQLGIAIGLFMTVSAAMSIPAGLLVQRVGWSRAIALVGLGAAIANAGIVWTARSWHHLVWLLVLAAVANAAAGPSANLGLVERVSRTSLGRAFAIKQAAIPLATLCAGLAVPVVALTVGWRWAFFGVAVGSLLLTVVAAWIGGAATRSATGFPAGRSTAPIPRRMRSPLLLLGGGAGLAGAAAGCLGGFLVVYAVSTGVGASAAGLLLTLGSAVSIVVRLSLGWWADRRPIRPFLVVICMLLVGSLGFCFILAANGLPALVAGTILSFGAAWGWNGLFHLALMSHYREHAAKATGIVQSLMFGATGIGPVLFGVAAEHIDYSVAWAGTAVVTVAAAALLAAGRARLSRAERFEVIQQG